MFCVTIICVMQNVVSIERMVTDFPDRNPSTSVENAPFLLIHKGEILAMFSTAAHLVT